MQAIAAASACEAHGVREPEAEGHPPSPFLRPPSSRPVESPSRHCDCDRDRDPPTLGLRFGNVALASHMVTFGCVSNVQAASDGQKKLASPFHAESPHGAVAAHFPHAPRARIA